MFSAQEQQHFADRSAALAAAAPAAEEEIVPASRRFRAASAADPELESKVKKACERISENLVR